MYIRICLYFMYMHVCVCVCVCVCTRESVCASGGVGGGGGAAWRTSEVCSECGSSLRSRSACSIPSHLYFLHIQKKSKTKKIAHI